MLLISPLVSVTKAKSTNGLEKEIIIESHPSTIQQKNFMSTSSDWKMMMLNASDGEASDSFGSSVSVSGNYALIGAPFNDNITGAAYIFKHIGTTWIQEAKLTAADSVPEDCFGWSVSLDGNTCVIGAIEDDDNGNRSGSAYIFTNSDTAWMQQAKLLASDGAPIDSFGNSVSISENYAVIGACLDDNSTGSAYVFERKGTTWTQQAKLLASDGKPDDHFGNSVSINGNHIVIGINMQGGENSTESAYVFERYGTTWTQEAKLVSPDSEPTGFGTSVSIHGDHIMIGAPCFDFLTGAAYIFKHNGTTWTQQAQLRGSDGNPLELFGWAVSISENYATTIGMSFFEHNGSVYIFKRNGTTWSQDAKLTVFTNQFSGLSNMISSTDTCVIVGNCNYNNSTGSAYVFWKPHPQFEITFKGSTTFVRNIGDANATNVFISRRLDGGFFFMGKNKTVILPSIPVGETKEARLGMIIGFGKTTITLSISCDQGVNETSSKQAFIFFFFLLGIK